MLAPSNTPIDVQPSVNPWFARPTTAFLILALVVGGICPLAIQFDQSISAFLRQIKLPGDVQKAISLSETFAHGLGVASILLTVFVVAVDRRRALYIAVLITALSGTTANVLKSTVVRVRPHHEGLQVKDHKGLSVNSPQAVDRSFWDARQRSFPSGHAATAWGLAIGLSLVFVRGWWIFGMLAVLASVQRIESGAHYPSDVLAGMAIAFLIAACILALPRVRKQLVG